MRKNLFILALLTTLFITACTRDNSSEMAAAQGKETKTNIAQTIVAGVTNKEKKGTLLFFINPTGIPCQIQNSILSGALPSIKDTVDVKYLQTTSEESAEYFYKYSIRGLPSIIIIDNKNNVIKRFSPGIQSGDTIIEAVKGL